MRVESLGVYGFRVEGLGFKAWGFRVGGLGFTGSIKVQPGMPRVQPFKGFRG